VSAVFRIAASTEDLIKAMVIRGIVFCAEQRIPYSVERDEFDAAAIHVIGEIGGEPVAVGRIRECGSHAVLGRIAVRVEHRGRGIGHALTDYLIAVARERGYSSCRMHAQSHLESFYASHGFRSEGERFIEAGIEHVAMVRHAPLA
jgi:predicted GNAT family N-acyltransferase